MESVTDPKLLEDRFFYKLGEFTYDRRKIVLAVGLIACLGMASMISMGADWAESWGEGDLESIEAASMRNNAFVAEDEGSQSFILLVHHSTLDDSSEEWRTAGLSGSVCVDG